MQDGLDSSLCHDGQDQDRPSLHSPCVYQHDAPATRPRYSLKETDQSPPPDSGSTRASAMVPPNASSLPQAYDPHAAEWGQEEGQGYMGSQAESDDVPDAVNLEILPPFDAAALKEWRGSPSRASPARPSRRQRAATAGAYQNLHAHWP